MPEQDGRDPLTSILIDAWTAARDAQVSTFVAEDSVIRNEWTAMAAVTNADPTSDTHYLGRLAAHQALTASSHNIAAAIRVHTSSGSSGIGPTDLAWFALSRTAVEAASIAHWILDTDASLNSRLLRMASFSIWSSDQHLKYAHSLDDDGVETLIAQEQWTATRERLIAAGFSAAGATAKASGNENVKAWVKIKRGDASIGTYNITQIVEAVNSTVISGYRRASGLVHHAPWTHYGQFRYDMPSNSGVSARTNVDQELLLATIFEGVTIMLGACRERQKYHGAPTSSTESALEEFISSMSELQELIALNRGQDD